VDVELFQYVFVASVSIALSGVHAGVHDADPDAEAVAPFDAFAWSYSLAPVFGGSAVAWRLWKMIRIIMAAHTTAATLTAIRRAIPPLGPETGWG